MFEDFEEFGGFEKYNNRKFKNKQKCKKFKGYAQNNPKRNFKKKSKRNHKQRKEMFDKMNLSKVSFFPNEFEDIVRFNSCKRNRYEK